MERIAPPDVDTLANILAAMPIITIAGLLTPHGERRDRAARIVVEEIVGRLNPTSAVELNQMKLPM